MKFFLGFLVGVVFFPVVAAVAGSLGLLPVAATASPPACRDRTRSTSISVSVNTSVAGEPSCRRATVRRSKRRQAIGARIASAFSKACRLSSCRSSKAQPVLSALKNSSTVQRSR